MVTDSTPTASPISQRQLNKMMVVLVLGVITTILDTTIVNIALDHLHTAFRASVADTQWVVTGYLLAYGAVIPVSGWASERFGARRVWMAAVATFMVGSLLCGVSTSLPELIGFRVLQGLGGGMVLPVTMTILNRAAGKDRIRQAIAMIGFVGQLGPILGPLIGGSIIHSVGWQWLFFVNLPICLAALILAPRLLPIGSTTAAAALDGLGFLLLTPAIVALVFGVSRAGSGGFTAPSVWLPLVLGVALVAAFAGHSLRTRRAALIDVRIFARRSFGLSSVVVLAAGFSLYGLIFLLPLFYQQVRGDSVQTTGLLLIPQGVGTMCFILLNRRLAGRVDTRLVIAAGVVITMIGVLPFALAHASGGDVLLLAGQFLAGFGMAAVSLPVMTLAFTSLSDAETPRGSAAFNVVKQVGAPFGVTVIAVILQHYLTHATTQHQALHAFTITFWWIFALSVIPLLFAFLIPHTRKDAESPTNTPEPAKMASAHIT